MSRKGMVHGLVACKPPHVMDAKDRKEVESLTAI